MRKEEWKSAFGFYGTGEVSNNGLFKYLNFNRTGKEKITIGSKASNGHLKVCYCQDNKRKTYAVHRLVAIAFVPIPEKYKGIPIDKLDVHHINFIPWDNRPENLCWLTKTEHLALHKSKPVFRYGLDGYRIDYYKSAREAERVLGIDYSSISSCCNGVYESAGGYQFSFENLDRIPPIEDKFTRMVETRKNKESQAT